MKEFFIFFTYKPKDVYNKLIIHLNFKKKIQLF